MKRIRIIAAAAVLALTAASPMSIYAEDSGDKAPEDTKAEDTTAEDATEEESSEKNTEETTKEETTEPTTEAPAPVYKITFLDFDGNKMQELEVTEGEAIDYSRVDTSVLRKHIDKYTEQEFSQWNVSPEIAESNLTIKALYRTATLKFESVPTKHRYVRSSGDIDTGGLKASITLRTQLPQTDDNGQYIVETKVADISMSCILKPSKLEDAFADGKTEASIEIFPIGAEKSLASYTINLVSDIGDVTRDGRIDAVDASRILRAYADLNSDEHKEISDDMLKYGDINDDGILDATDASLVLRYYVISSAHKTPDWEEIAGIK